MCAIASATTASHEIAQIERHSVVKSEANQPLFGSKPSSGIKVTFLPPALSSGEGESTPYCLAHVDLLGGDEGWLFENRCGKLRATKFGRTASLSAVRSRSCLELLVRCKVFSFHSKGWFPRDRSVSQARSVMMNFRTKDSVCTG